VAAALMVGALWLVGDINFVATLLLGGVVYSAALASVGGLAQRDMRVLWRAIPLQRLRNRLGIK
jgi:hypothetical protein